MRGRGGGVGVVGGVGVGGGVSVEFLLQLALELVLERLHACDGVRARGVVEVVVGGEVVVVGMGMGMGMGGERRVVSGRGVVIVMIVEIDQALDEGVGVLVVVVLGHAVVVVALLLLLVMMVMVTVPVSGRRREPIRDHRPHGRDLGRVFALGTVLDRHAHRLLDAHPVVHLRDRRRRLVDAPVLLRVLLPRDLVLPLRIAHHLLVLQHQPLFPPSSSCPPSSPSSSRLHGNKLIMRRRAPQPAFFRPVRPVGVFAVLEIEADLVEALFRDEVFALGAQVSSVDDGVDEFVWVGAQVSAGFDAADAFEAEGVPDSAGGEVGFVDEVEDGVGVALFVGGEGG